MSRPVQRKPLAVPRRPGAPSGMRRPPAQARPGGGNAPGSKGTDHGYLYVAGIKDASKRVQELWTKEDRCPLCSSDRQFEPGLRIMVSPCYHKICEDCINKNYSLGPEPCYVPGCGKILRKANFAHITFEDLKIEKEVAVRRRIAEIFNKTRDDFGTLKEYNQYLEDVETLTFNILNDIDVEKMEAQIEAYQAENASLIAKNKHKSELDQYSQAERDELEKRARAERVRLIEEAERIDRLEEERTKQEIVDALSRPGGGEELAREIRAKADKAKADRAAALAAAVPPSLAALNPAHHDDKDHPPTSPSYAGPYVPIPYADPDLLPWSHWYEMKEDYVDGRSGVVWAKEDRDKKVRGGGWDLHTFWEMEIRGAVEGLGIEPL